MNRYFEPNDQESIFETLIRTKESRNISWFIFRIQEPRNNFFDFLVQIKE